MRTESGQITTLCVPFLMFSSSILFSICLIKAGEKECCRCNVQIILPYVVKVISAVLELVRRILADNVPTFRVL